MFDDMPRFARLHFAQLRAHVRAELFPHGYLPATDRARLSQLEQVERMERARSLVNEATVVAFVFVISRFLSRGTDMAKATVDLLRESGIPRFTIGSVEYAERNENVMMGQVLAEQLIQSLPTELRAFLVGKKYLYEVLMPYKERVHDQ
ncbi:MAG: hypothetical protein IPH75_16215 [bacterium]|nr:hypothetical protein [bacterium]